MNIIEQLKQDEGLRLRPYHCTEGKLTIGYGRNLDDVGISPAEAEAMLKADVDAVEADLRRRLPVFATLNEARRDALINMGFQLGVDGLLKFKLMIAALERQDWDEVGRQALDSRWAGQTPLRAGRVALQLQTGVEHD